MTFNSIIEHARHVTEASYASTKVSLNFMSLPFEIRVQIYGKAFKGLLHVDE